MKNSMNSSLGIFFGLFASLSMAAMSVLIHFTTDRYTLGDIVFYRSLFMMMVALPFASKHFLKMFDKKSIYVWLRSLIAGIAMITYIKTLQLGHVALANSMAALTQVIVALIAFFLLKENLQKQQILGLFVVAGGVVFIQSGGVTDPVPLIVGVGLFSAILASISFVLLRKISREFPLSLIVFTVALLSFCLSFTLDRSHPLPSLSFDDSPLMGICLSALLMQLFMTLCFRVLKAGQAVVLNESFIIFSGVFSALYTGSMMQNTEWALYLVIIGGIALVNLPQKRVISGTHPL